MIKIKILIVSNGTIDDMSMLEELVKQSDYIICADGGTRYFYEKNMKPDVILGDFDSLEEKILKDMKDKEIDFFKFPVNKDKTDTELAVEYAVQKGAKDITLLGATGSRLDHTLGNIMLLREFVDKNIKIRVLDSHNEVYMIKDSITLDKKENTFVSIIPITDTVKGVTLKGFKYETNNTDFKLGSTFGISNEIIDKVGHITVNDGICLVIRALD